MLLGAFYKRAARRSLADSGSRAAPLVGWRACLALARSLARPLSAAAPEALWWGWGVEEGADGLGVWVRRVYVCVCVGGEGRIGLGVCGVVGGLSS